MDAARERRLLIRRFAYEHAYLRQLWYICQSARDSPEQVSAPARNELRQLDLRRVGHQLAIYEASGGAGAVCGQCRGRCCGVHRANASHFYSVDFWLRRYTDAPVPHVDRIWVEHPLRSWPRALGTRISERLIRPALSLLPRRPGISQQRLPQAMPCMYLLERGCSLELAQRPLTCVIYMCRAFQVALTEEALKAVVDHARGMTDICIRVCRLLRAEGRLSPFRGRLRFFISGLHIRPPMPLLRHVARLL